MSEALSLAEVKSHLSELVSRVHSQHERVTVTVHGRPSAVLLAVEDLEALEETIAVLSDTEALRQLAASDAELARGEGEDIETLTVAMKRRRDLRGGRPLRTSYLPDGPTPTSGGPPRVGRLRGI